MSGKLDQSLDEILSTRRKTTGRRGRGRRVATAAKKATAPTGGIHKPSKAKAPTKGGAKVEAAVPAVGDSKIIVSNLPSDVNEAQIKEYFTKSVAPVRRVMLTYGPNGVSRGVATIIFGKPGSANDALVKLNGMLVDKRPMKIEVVLDAKNATQPPPAKALGDRMTQSKSAAARSGAKSATKDAAPATRGAKAARGRGRRARTGRPKAKTADELDAEMADYFNPNDPNSTTAASNSAAPATNGAAPAAANGTTGDELGMDEIS